MVGAMHDDYFAVYDSVNLVTKLRHTTNGGKTWYTMKWESRVNFNPIVYKFEPKSIYHPSDSLFVLACDGGLMFRSENVGKSWDTIQLDVQKALMMAPMIKVSSEISIIGYGSKMYYMSRNKCKTWQKMSMPKIVDSLLLYEMFSPDTNTIIMRFRTQGKGGSRFIISKDYGVTWQYSELSEITTTPVRISDYHFVSDKIGFGVGREYLKPPGMPLAPAYDIIYKTTDGGSSWTEKMRKENQRNFGLDGVAFLDSMNGIAVGTSGKILRTIDGGETWKQEYLSSYTEIVDILDDVKFLSKDKAFASSYNSGKFFVYRKDLAGVTSNDKEEYISSISISPNPARGRELPKVSFKIEHQSDVKIELYNSLGSYVQKLYEQGNIRVGEYSVNIIDNLPSGTYFVKMRINNKTETEKLIIVD